MSVEADALPKCPACGTELPQAAMFCGECGRAVSANPAPRMPRLVVPPPPPPPSPPEPAGPPAPEPVELRPLRGDSDEQPLAEPGRDAVGSTPEPIAESEPPSDSGSRAGPAALPEAQVRAEPELRVGPELRAEPEPLAEPELGKPKPPPAMADSDPQPEFLGDLEATRIVAGSGGQARFVLQFSTGESARVWGTGLIGRNPMPEPGEYFDHVVTIVDAGKSVSKTHLEFGQEHGEFWVLDRYSANGTVLRQPDAAPVRCEAGTRRLVPRGARVDIGEQFFVVS